MRPCADSSSYAVRWFPRCAPPLPSNRSCGGELLTQTLPLTTTTTPAAPSSALTKLRAPLQLAAEPRPARVTARHGTSKRPSRSRPQTRCSLLGQALCLGISRSRPRRWAASRQALWSSCPPSPSPHALRCGMSRSASSTTATTSTSGATSRSTKCSRRCTSARSSPSQTRCCRSARGCSRRRTGASGCTMRSEAVGTSRWRRGCPPRKE
mmetsp:Transcript_37560/g.87818  ORF Transcript_37560/g.87818 Transcript_37560/m.87818 type:complete len:210 (+) Transcript_37560:105-734(+)